jgi:hypothetical protein
VKKEVVSVETHPDRKKLYNELPNDMNDVFTRFQEIAIDLEKAMKAPKPKTNKQKKKYRSPEQVYKQLQAVLLEIDRHPLQRALPPRYGCWPKEARPIGRNLYQYAAKIVAAGKAEGRTDLKSDELAILQEKWFAFLKALDPQFKVPEYIPGVPLSEPDVDDDGDIIMGGDGQSAASEHVRRPVARARATARTVEDEAYVDDLVAELTFTQQLKELILGEVDGEADVDESDDDEENDDEA